MLKFEKIGLMILLLIVVFINTSVCYAKENSLNISFKEVTFDFDEDTYIYDIDVDFLVRKLTPNVTLNGKNVDYEVKNNDLIIVGYNRVSIKVNKKIYYFNIMRKGSMIDTFKTFSYTGNYEAFTVPKTGTYRIELWGARGGNISTHTGGAGAYTSGNIELKENEILYFYVGGPGSETTIFGGFNGGGDVGADNQLRFGRSGGGATDVRLVSGVWNNFDSLKSRIMVAAGGGGANFRSEGYGEGDGGAAGGLSGYTGEVTGSTRDYGQGIATGGTQTSGGTFTWSGTMVSPGMNGGSFGAGGGLSSKNTQGGGGGGYYGGASNQHAGAGGGSSFISGHAGCDAILNSSTSSNIVHSGDSIHASGKYFTNTMMIDGKGILWTDKEGEIFRMPNPAGGTYALGVGNNGAGAARISLLEDGEDDNYLRDIQLSSGSIDFDKETNHYRIDLTEDDTTLEVRAIPQNIDAAVSGNGIYKIEPGTKSIDIMVTGLDGSIRVYTLEVVRVASSNPFLKGILINGEEMEGFEATKDTYDIMLPYNATSVDVNGILANDYQTITGDGVQMLVENKATAKLFVVSEDKNANKMYTVNFTREKSTKLHKVTFNDVNLELFFEDDKYNYEIGISKTIHSLEDLDIIPYYEGVDLKIVGNKYIGEQSNIITITSSLEDLEPSVYTIKVNYKNDIAIETKDYTCTGVPQTFVTPTSGTYKVELWGANGGNINKYLGGYGAYTSGSINLVKDEILYIYVGCRGNESSIYGGYNGGGDIGAGMQISFGRAGGGATDVRLANGTWNDFESLKSRIMVAAGGGGANFRSQGYGEGNGGSGGGLIGYNGITTNSPNSYGRGNATGGTQTLGGKFTWNGAMPSPGIPGGSFGIGGGNTSVLGQGGGGGGYYGGAGNQHGGGAGGSSFISGHDGSNAISENSSVNNIVHMGDSTHYSGKKFNNSIMIDGNGYSWTNTKGNLELMPNPTGGYFSSGMGNNTDGYARISTLDALPNDNYLSSLTLTSNNEEIKIDFEPWILEYNVHLTDKQVQLDINAIPMDLKADVRGTGVIEVAPNETQHDIVVTAEDGSIRTYTINITRDPSSDSKPFDIELKRLSKNLCKLNETYCLYNFSEDNYNYEIFLPYNTKEVEISPVLKSKWQMVEYKVSEEIVDTNIISLNKETTVVEVKIISEDGNHFSTYKYTFKRDMTGNNNLTNITITNPDVEIPDFSPNTYEYYLTLPKGYDSYDVTVETEAEKAVYDIEGNTNLKFGMNDCYITVKAENNDEKMYIIHMYKEYEENVLLNTLKVWDGSTELELAPVFDNKINNYNLQVGKDVDNVRIEAMAIDSNATVSGIGIMDLEPGLNTLAITVSIGETKNVYTINVFKEKDNNPNIKNIVVDGYMLDKEFDKDELEYYVYLKNNETTLKLDVEMESSRASYTVSGNENLAKTINEIIVTGIAEDKTTKVYKIYAVKEISNNNYLVSLTTDVGTFDKEFDKEILEYNLSITSDITKVEVSAVAEDSKALVEGMGTYYLDYGLNEIIVRVTSEQLETREYKIIIDRPLNDDVTLKEVQNNRGSTVTEVEDKNLGYDYLINVQNNVTSIEITGIPTAATSRVTGNRVYNLNTGNNDITLRVKSEAGTTKDYIVRVVRDRSNNDDLDFLFVEEGGLSPHFNETTIFYDVLVPNNTNTLHIEAITEDVNATFEVVGGIKQDDNIYTYDITDLEVDTPKFIEVVVTAENGVDKKIYTLSVIKQKAKDPDEDLSLVNLETNRGLLTPLFNSDTLNYELEVENDIADIMVSATPSSDKVRIEGEGVYNLNVGKNGIGIFVIGESGVQRDYQIVVTRKKSSDATLSSLVVKGSSINPNFDKDKDAYTLTTSYDKLEFIAITPTESDASYEIIGNELLITGENMVIIRVTAPDGVTTKDYTLTVTKQASKNNNLMSLDVVDYELVPKFHKAVTFYAVEADYSVRNILITAIAEDPKATIEGTGIKTLEVGENYFDIIVTSEFGNKKIYTVLITREASDNAFLNSLVSSVGTLEPAFDKEINEYNIEVGFDTEEITFNGTPEDSLAIVKGNDTYKLDYGENKIDITVTSESGVINVYTVNVKRSPLVSPYLKSLEVKDYDLSPEFNKVNLEYYVNVNNEVKSLDLSYIPEEEKATVLVTGNENFVVGINEVHITVTSSGGEEALYVIYVNREMSTNNYLNSLILSTGELDPEFNKETLTYNVLVDSSVDEVEVFATTEDEASKITKGLGKHTISYGTNTIEINVRSQKGLIRTYRVIVTKDNSSNDKLGDILVKTTTGEVILADRSFDKDINNYEYNLDSRLDYIVIETYLGDEFQSVIGDGIKELKAGVNTFDIVVTSGNGTVNTYMLTIDNPKSSNNYLGSLIPSSGELSPTFDKEVLEYTLELSNSVNTLSFAATLEDRFAKITGNEVQGVPVGISTRTIEVTAEDGSIKTYKINVQKESASEVRLESLRIEGYEFEFDPDTFTYNIRVASSKKKLLESEIMAIPKDENATVNLMGDLELTRDIVNIYTIEVIAKDGYTTQTYTLNITRDSEEYTIRSDVYEIVRYDSETEEDYVIGIQPSTVISDFKSNFLNEQSMLHVYLDTTESDDSELTATALILKLEKDGYVYDRLRVIVRGDLTSDGKVNITDQVKLINYVGRTVTFNKYEMLAADLTFDGKVNITDQVKLINYVGRTVSDLNKKPTS